MKCGDKVRCGNGKRTWRVIYVHSDGNVAITTGRRTRHYVHPAELIAEGN